MLTAVCCAEAASIESSASTRPSWPDLQHMWIGSKPSLLRSKAALGQRSSSSSAHSRRPSSHARCSGVSPFCRGTQSRVSHANERVPARVPARGQGAYAIDVGDRGLGVQQALRDVRVVVLGRHVEAGLAVLCSRRQAASCLVAIWCVCVCALHAYRVRTEHRHASGQQRLHPLEVAHLAAT